MNVSFQWKIRIIVCLLFVCLSSLGVCCLYLAASDLTLGLGSELAKLNTLKLICIAVVAGSFILSAFFSLAISRFLSTPLKRLADGAKKIGQGYLNTRIPIPANDEFKDIAREFNRMARNLQKITVSRDVLEVAIRQKQKLEKDKEQVIQELTMALDEIKTLKGIVPICAICKKIRDDKGYWNLLENYIEKHSEASFSHGMCPQCMDAFYGPNKWSRKF